MKKSLIPFFFGMAMTCMSQLAFGQQLEIQVSTGYALPFMGDDLGVSGITNDSGFTRESVVFGTFGQGVPLDLDIAWKQGGVGFHLGVNYLLGTPVFVDGDFGPISNFEYATRSRQLLLQPGFSVHGKGEKLKPFAEVGLSLPLSSTLMTTLDRTDIVNNTAVKTEQESVIQGSFSLGFYTQAGVSIPLGDQMDLVVSAHLTAQRIKGASGETVKFQVDGTDLLPDMDVLEKQWEYVEVYSTESNGHPDNANTDSEMPAQVLQQSWNMSRAALMVGIGWRIGG